jgi:hypothetical protein
MSWMLNNDGSVAVSMAMFRRRVYTFLDYKVVDASAVSFTDGDLELAGSEAAWNSSGWVRIGATPTTANNLSSFSATIPAQSGTKVLMLREGVWKHSGDSSWVGTYGGSDGTGIAALTDNMPWYSQTGAVGFYCPMAFPVNTPSSSAAHFYWNDGSYSDADLANWLTHNFYGQSVAQWGEGLTYVKATGEALLWPLGAGSYGSMPYVPRMSTATVSTDSTNVRNGQSSVVTFTFPSNDANDVATILAGANVVAAHQAQRYSGQFSVAPYVAGRQAQVLVAGGTLSNLACSVSGGAYSNTWTATFTPAQNYEGPASISFQELNIKNTHSFGLVTLRGSLAADAMYVNGKKPVASLSATKSVLRVGETASLMVTLSSSASDFTSADIVVSNATMTSFRGSSATKYSALLTPPRNFTGNCVVAVPDNAFTATWGEKNIASNLTIPVDTTVPYCAIASNVASLSVGQTANISFSLNKPISYFTVNTPVVTNGTLSNFSGNGTSYSAIFTPKANTTGPANVTVAGGVLFDAVGNQGATSTLTLSVNTLAPSVNITSSSAFLGIGANANISFALSEDSTTFTGTNLTVSGGTLSNVRGTAKRYTAVFTPSANSTANGTITVPTGAFRNIAGSASATGSLANPIQIDTRPLTIQITSSAASLNRNVGAVTLTLQMNKPVTLFSVTNINCSTGSVSALRGSGSTYYATYRPAQNFSGTVTITIPAGSFNDNFGNPNTAAALATPLTVTA